MAAPMKTVLEVLESTAKYFADKGVESPRLNIDLLLAHVLGKKQRMDLYMEFDRPLGERELNTLRPLVKQRGEGVPLQHLLGTVEFYKREFISDSRALIPRPETERLVELILKLELPADARCVDVGTGSGVIALTLAAERPEARVQAVDRSPNALTLARENAAKLGLDGRVEFLTGDLLAPCAGPFDLVAANLPVHPRARHRGPRARGPVRPDDGPRRRPGRAGPHHALCAASRRRTKIVLRPVDASRWKSVSIRPRASAKCSPRAATRRSRR